MASSKPRYPIHEIARHGGAIYKTDVLPHLKVDDRGKFVAIDIDSKAYAIDADELGACQQLRRRFPDAQIWLVRAGSRSVYHLGVGAMDDS